MKLTTLKSRLSTVGPRLSALPVATGSVERKRGSAGVRDRDRIRKRDKGECQNCGWLGRDVDHDVPLWAGGSDDDDSKRVLCGVCHDAKSKLETAQRNRGMYDRDAVLALMRQLEQERRVTPKSALYANTVE